MILTRNEWKAWIHNYKRDVLLTDEEVDYLAEKAVELNWSVHDMQEGIRELWNHRGLPTSAPGSSGL